MIAAGFPGSQRHRARFVIGHCHRCRLYYRRDGSPPLEPPDPDPGLLSQRGFRTRFKRRFRRQCRQATVFEGSGFGRVILTATDSTQYAWEGEKIIGGAENSVFTHHLIEGIRTGQADMNADGWVALDEWFDYVYDHVVQETPRQTPGKWSYKQQGDIWIARDPHPAPPKPTLPQVIIGHHGRSAFLGA